MFADQHRDDVVGIVLVDSMHEQQLSSLRRRLSPGAWSEIAGLFGTANPERMDIEESVAQVSTVGPLGDLPLAILTAGLHETDADEAGISHAAAGEIDLVMDELWPQLQLDLATRSVNSRHVTVEDSGHFIQTDDPDAVVEAVRWVADR